MKISPAKNHGVREVLPISRVYIEQPECSQAKLQEGRPAVIDGEMLTFKITMLNPIQQELSKTTFWNIAGLYCCIHHPPQSLPQQTIILSKHFRIYLLGRTLPIMIGYETLSQSFLIQNLNSLLLGALNYCASFLKAIMNSVDII